MLLRAQAPAANHKASAETMLETFALSNISPQVGRGFNRDYWARFERFVHLLTRSCSDVFIVTGPLYLPTRTPAGYVLQHPMIGAAVAVAPHGASHERATMP
jgi:endonuclease G